MFRASLGAGGKVWFGGKIWIHAFGRHEHSPLGEAGDLGEWHRMDLLHSFGTDVQPGRFGGFV